MMTDLRGNIGGTASAESSARKANAARALGSRKAECAVYMHASVPDPSFVSRSRDVEVLRVVELSPAESNILLSYV
jgi:hypothetical protein